jgi:hypothetical protein
MERIALVASLRPDAHERAVALAGDLPDAPGIGRQSVFLSPTEVIFVLEGEDPETQVREWLDDPVQSTAIEPWLALFDGPLHRAPEIGFRESG